MQLRNRIRPPERFNQDQFYSPCTQRSLRVPQNQDYIQSTQFDPNLPPAAFPTLDHLSPPSLRDKENGRWKGQEADLSKRPREQEKDGENTENKRVRGAGPGVQTRPPASSQSCFLSNGDFNPVYRKNMTILANVGRESSIERYLMDSDMDEAMTDAPDEEDIEAPSATASVRHCKWSDLSPQIQVEIIDNMLQEFDWPTICHLLGLTAEEREETQQKIRQRDRQDKQEDIQLQDMRERQLRALLRVDNTKSGHNRVPHQGIFSKISRQVSGKLQNQIDSDISMCQQSELLDAKLFLRTRGLDCKYAGEWGNGTSAWQALEDDDIEPCLDDDERTQQRLVDCAEFDATGLSARGDENANVPDPDDNCTIQAYEMAKYCPNSERNKYLHQFRFNKPRQCNKDSQPRHKVVYYDPRGSEPCRLSVGAEKAAHVCDTRWRIPKLVSRPWEMPLTSLSFNGPRAILGTFYNTHGNKFDARRSQNAAFAPPTRLPCGSMTDRRAGQTAFSSRPDPRHGSSASEVRKEIPLRSSSGSTYATLSESGRTSSPVIWTPKATPNTAVSTTSPDCLPADENKQSPHVTSAPQFPLEARKVLRESTAQNSGHEVLIEESRLGTPPKRPVESLVSKENKVHSSKKLSDGDDSSEDSHDNDYDEVVLLPV
ncbi:hypothetical protein AtubIFM55763_002822 [Aspergillus tubingensis]|uniref:Similar to An08g05960 n=1 Tax=Aspergillus niger TaxID=5061 RepID=A0A117DZZ2_ASPNG|nr:transport protein Avl9 family protein [Aspergillus tubingensis]GAQ41813.1 similar to An08g05960 [Aspergillus niger]GFN18829.1 transport protein Avl9 family protein [Aspergillus tubingensis]GLA72290.1 hypothetical protein AtubIFM55763_002822 [Aspergillus tubingensis]GLA95370.1 hypothetical protein AtubIFM57143_002378 [Aspergillus tubingensis]GLB16638.1 hypothetical protein AtubIFM61612_006492 [Aspergillus tubingensis]